MKKLLLIFWIFCSCSKNDDSISIRETGQFYFWNPYPINEIGSGIDIVVDGGLIMHYKAQGINNGVWVKKPIGVHSYSYMVYDGIANYSSHGKANIYKNKNDTIKMIKP